MRRPDPLPQRPRVEPVVVAPPERVFDDAPEDVVISAPETAAAKEPRDQVSIDEEIGEAGEDHIPTAVITPMRRPKASTKRTADVAAEAAVDDVAALDHVDDALADVDASGDADSSDAVDAVVGWRDVWRAARAKRKALRSEVRRFTGRARKRRLIWVSSLASVVLLVAGSLAIAYSPLFAVRTITITGTSSLDPEAVKTALESQIGKPLALVNDSEVKAALVTFPFVETYTVQARPPHELVITIVERTPVGVVETPAGFSLADAAGVVLSTTPEPPAGYPLIEVADGLASDTFRSIGMVLRSVPESIRVAVARVKATTPADVTLIMNPTGTQIIWGNADDSRIKSAALEKAMLARPMDTVSVYDVSSPTAIVMR